MRQRRLLFGLHLRDDRSAAGNLYADVRYGAYRRLDGAQNRGAKLRGATHHTPCIQERARREGLHTAQREMMSRVHIKIDIA